MRKGIAGLVVLFAVAGIAVLLVRAADTARNPVLLLADDPVSALVSITKGQRFCQEPIRLPGDIREAIVIAAPGAKDRGPIAVTATERGSGRVLGTARRPRQVLTGKFTTFRFDRTVRGDQTIALCVRNEGRGSIEIWGDRPGEGRSTLTPSTGLVDGVDTNGDISGALTDGRTRTVLERIPSAISSASAFKLGGVGGWLTWALAVLVVVGVPVLLARAVGRIAGDDR